VESLPPEHPQPPAFTFPAVGVAAWDQLQEKSLPDIERQFADYGNLHAGWVRADFSWDVIQPTSTTFRWAGYDQWVGVARAKGQNVIATVDYTPAWANGGHSDHSYAPTSPAAFGTFAGEVAARYAAQGVHVYEIWNEPNIIQFWKPKPNPAAYTESLNAAYAAIKRADPSATVLTGGSSPAGTGSESYSPPDWLQALYATGAKFDGVADHPYVDDDWFNWKQMAEGSGSTLRSIMEAHGDAAKKVWATEVGCSWQKVAKEEAAGRALCAERLEQAFSKWHSYSWAAALCWFTYWDPNVYGLVDDHWTPRPGWYAFQTAAARY
jgi:hypothetical protein